jgi:hypothetical protein
VLLVYQLLEGRLSHEHVLVLLDHGLLLCPYLFRSHAFEAFDRVLCTFLLLS